MRRIVVLLAVLLCFAASTAEPTHWQAPASIPQVRWSSGASTAPISCTSRQNVEHPAGLVINLHGAGMTGAAAGVADELQRRRRPARVRGGVPGRHRPQLGRRPRRIDTRPPRASTTWASWWRSPIGSPHDLRHRARPRVRDRAVGGGLHGDAAGVPARRRRRRDRAGRRVLGSAVPCAPSRPVSVFATHGMADQVVPYNGGGMVGRGGASDIVAPQAMMARWRELDHCPAPGRGRPGPWGTPLHVRRLRQRHRSCLRRRRRRSTRVVCGRIGRQRTILRHPRQVRFVR